MTDPTVEFHRGEFIVSTDRARIDPDAALALVHATHWGGGMDRAVLLRAIANSITFGVFKGKTLIGFGRAVTDMATYATSSPRPRPADMVFPSGPTSRLWRTACSA